MSSLVIAAAAVTAARVAVSGAGSAVVNGAYARRDASTVPAAFARVCVASGWDAASTWARLNGPRDWWEAPNASYMYLNRGDGLWWLDSGHTVLGLYVSRAAGAGAAPPTTAWEVLGEASCRFRPCQWQSRRASSELRTRGSSFRVSLIGAQLFGPRNAARRSFAHPATA